VAVIGCCLRVVVIQPVVLRNLATGLSPLGVVFDGVNVWVANSAENTVSRYHRSFLSEVTGPCPEAQSWPSVQVKKICEGR